MTLGGLKGEQLPYAVISAFVVFVTVVSGCGPTRAWQYDYDAAVRQARSRQRDLLILYKDPLDAESGIVRDTLQSAAARVEADGKVWCMLVPFHAPSRRFMAQYGVFEAPAIVVVHPDSTYHALSGVPTEDDVVVFLKAAKGPGKAPTINPQVPHRATFSHFNIYERAQSTARNQNRRLLIVYKWWLDGRSSTLIQRLSRPHVAVQLAETVKCLLDWDHIANRGHVAKYGVRDFPALILVEPDGAYRVLRGLRTADEIIRFILAGRQSREFEPAPTGG